jgi:hypothetical protein
MKRHFNMRNDRPPKRLKSGPVGHGKPEAPVLMPGSFSRAVSRGYRPLSMLSAGGSSGRIPGDVAWVTRTE